MKRFACIFVAAFWFLTVPAQPVTVTGTVRDAKTRKPVGSANVMLQNTDRRAMYAYAITREDGAYTLTYSGKADTLLVVVTGFNIREQTRMILARSQRVDFSVEEAQLKIREVVVKAPAVTTASASISASGCLRSPFGTSSPTCGAGAAGP